ncbi:MAG: hypothetical protein LLF94_02680 [Chlamydiales bacterium]|nr:hypothetical protein [Chlamydiales bacterium]
MQSVGLCPYRLLYTHPVETALPLGALCASMLVLPVPTMVKVIAIAANILLPAIAFSIAYAYGSIQAQEKNMEKEVAELAYIDTVERQTADIKNFKRKFQEISTSLREQNAALRDFSKLLEAHLLVQSIVLSYGLPYKSCLVTPDFSVSKEEANELHHKMWQTIEYDLHHYPRLGNDPNISLATINQTHQARKVHHEKLAQQIDIFLNISRTIIASRWEWVSNTSFTRVQETNKYF